MTWPPVPDEWLTEHHQDLRDSHVLSRDTDGDGFTTLDEWLGHTDPSRKEDHPPYYTKLFFRRFLRLPVPVMFEARMGNTLLINVVNAVGGQAGPTQFLQVGNLVKGTRFRITKLDIKPLKREGIMMDDSDVTLENIETGDVVVIARVLDVDAPTTYVELIYLWSGNGTPAKTTITLRQGREFSLKPEPNVKFKCLRYSDSGATVLKEDENKIIKIVPLPDGQ